MQMRNDRTKTEMTIKQSSEDNFQMDSEKKMSAMMKEHEKRITELRHHSDKEKVYFVLLRPNLKGNTNIS